MSDKRALFLIGPPGCGKTSFRVHGYHDYHDWVVISSDDILEQYARENQLSYQQAFQGYASDAQKQMMFNVDVAIAQGRNIIWDQTNLTRATRDHKIAKLKTNGYELEAVYFVVEEDVLFERLFNRAKQTGKVIPIDVVVSMIKSYQFPTYDEGFDVICYVDAIGVNLVKKGL